MTNLFRKYKLHYLIVLAVVMVYFIPLLFAEFTSDAKFSSQVFTMDKGYGYEIMVNGKVFIHQEYIPGIKGYNLFESKDKAQIVADMVVNKLLHDESPTVSGEELIKAGVIQHETVN
ncbi:DUF4907 domain-containing protein [Carboxylicivirga caseinilyticus]|uniref:DUF4907 domain-containing protein n=1 Tax=Carboxylicivirga caseinilyticus TaxID=3417572 RepID=UPI003D347D1E|nr:DUF4907 domain-containing protein [Marinilabiliaceae bacterium A049]